MEKTIERRKVTFERIPELTEEEQEVLDGIKRGLQDIREGRVYSIEQIKGMFELDE